MTTEALDVQHREVSSEIVPAKPATGLAAWTPSFALAVDEQIELKRQKDRFFREILDEGTHYGKIPGVEKPSLWKPGAEMLCANMGLQKEIDDATPPIIDYDGTAEGHGEALIRFHKICRIYRQIGLLEHERMLVAKSEGVCSSRESKYRWREAKRLCPVCNGAFIIKGKAEYGGGWLCFKKQGGCGAKFEDGDTAITSQTVGKIPNPDVADLENTICKIAEKRAFVGCTLLATGCSDIFTADVEDFTPSEHDVPPTETAARSATRDDASGSNPGRRAQDGTSTATPESDDPVRKGKALTECRNTRRKYFLSEALYAQMLIDLFPQHVSAVNGSVSEADLSLAELTTFWKALERKGRSIKTRPPSEAPPYEAGLEDELPL